MSNTKDFTPPASESTTKGKLQSLEKWFTSILQARQNQKILLKGGLPSLQVATLPTFTQGTSYDLNPHRIHVLTLRGSGGVILVHEYTGNKLGYSHIGHTLNPDKALSLVLRYASIQQRNAALRERHSRIWKRQRDLAWVICQDDKDKFRQLLKPTTWFRFLDLLNSLVGSEEDRPSVFHKEFASFQEEMQKLGL